LLLNVRLAAPELAYILHDSGGKILFFQNQFLPLVDALRGDLRSVKSFHLLDAAAQAPWISPDNYEAMLSRSTPSRADIMEVDEDAPAELFYTSGTSANPKGVVLSHRNVYLHAIHVCLGFHTEVGAVELHTIPLFHANGWGVAHFLTLLGGKHVMVPRFDPPEIFRLIQQERAQFCSLVPTMATALVNCPERTKYNLSSLQRVTMGGAASSPTLIREVEEKLGCTAFTGYGLTETCPALTTAQMKPGMDWGGEGRFTGQASTGYPFPGMEVRVVDVDDNDVPRDGKSVGEVVARSDGVMQGYWQQPEATAQVMRGGWFHTGDMATWDENGYLLVVDRKKDIIVSGGENISSLEVEKALMAHPAVMELAVIPVPDPRWGEVPKALVVLKPGAQATEQELLDFCRSRIAHYKCPRSVEFFESLPKTGTGKILKRDLRKKYWQGQDTIRPESVEAKKKVTPV
jgi:fatty-acyl-CoA synthase